MFINKAKDGLNNVCGKNVAFLRKNMGLSLSASSPTRSSLPGLI